MRAWAYALHPCLDGVARRVLRCRRCRCALSDGGLPSIADLRPRPPSQSLRRLSRHDFSPRRLDRSCRPASSNTRCVWSLVALTHSSSSRSSESTRRYHATKHTTSWPRISPRRASVCIDGAAACASPFLTALIVRSYEFRAQQDFRSRLQLGASLVATMFASLTAIFSVVNLQSDESTTLSSVALAIAILNALAAAANSAISSYLA